METDDILNMPDDQFEQMPWEDALPAEAPTEDLPQDEPTGEVEEEAVVEETLDDSPEETVTEEVIEESTEETVEEESTETSEDETDDDSSDDTDVEETSSEVDYKAEYERLLAPFTANGKQIKVENVDEAVQLMQMGANYNKKMAALKPGLKVLKMLENNDLLDEGKLSYLIDLDKKDPGAIKKLVKDSQINTLDLEESDSEEYKAKSYSVDERELLLDEVLESIKGTPTYADTVNIVSTTWDQESRTQAVNNPQIIKVINDHKQAGIYDQITAEIEREKMLGRLSGLSDIEAYRQTGDKLHREGRFNTAPNQDKAPPAKQKAPSKPDPKTVQKKKAATITKSKPASTPPEYNPLSLSDEEFEKQISGKFL